MVAGDGFEPSKASLADLQSAPFDRSGIQPYGILSGFGNMERVTGVEPVYPAWKAGAQPLCHTRNRSKPTSVYDTQFLSYGTDGESRTHIPRGTRT